MGPPETVAMVERAGVTLVRVREVHTARGIIDKVRCVGSVLGLRDRADELITGELEPVVHALRRLKEAVTRKPQVAFLLQFRDGAPIGAGRGTSAQGLLDMVSADNVLADFEGWKPVSMEAMSQAAPDFVVITERGVRGAGGAATVPRSSGASACSRQWRASQRRSPDRDGRHGDARLRAAHDEHCAQVGTANSSCPKQRLSTTMSHE